MNLDTKKSYQILSMNTLAFTVSFMIWLMYAGLIDSLTKPVMIDGKMTDGLLPGLKEYAFFLKSIPILTGSLIRLPIGTLTDKFGGRPVFISVLLIAAAGAFMVSFVNSVAGFVLAGLVFGLAGTTFAVGIAFSSIWFSKGKQGLALGIFGAGNAGAAITNLLTPILLTHFLQRQFIQIDGVKTTVIGNPEGWRTVPLIYAGVMLTMAIAFWLLTENRKIASEKTLAQRLAPLKQIQVWRFGVYYLFLFGGFVALSLTLKNYYENVYDVSPTNAGALVCCFALLSAGFRAVGGWMSDKYGARAVMYGVLISCIICSATLL